MGTVSNDNVQLHLQFTAPEPVVWQLKGLRPNRRTAAVVTDSSSQKHIPTAMSSS